MSELKLPPEIEENKVSQTSALQNYTTSQFCELIYTLPNSYLHFNDLKIPLEFTNIFHLLIFSNIIF